MPLSKSLELLPVPGSEAYSYSLFKGKKVGQNP